VGTHHPGPDKADAAHFHSCESRVNEICKKINSEGILSRVSMTFMATELKRVRKELVDLEQNTQVRYLPHLPTIAQLTPPQTTTKGATARIDERK